MTKAAAYKIWNSLTAGERDVLVQLKSVRWDGFISSKVGRDGLVAKGLATRYEGYNTITFRGLGVLHNIGKLEDLTRGGES